MRHLITAALIALFATAGAAGQTTLRDEPVPRLAPRDVTLETLANPKALATLEKTGQMLMRDGFEAKASLKNDFETRGKWVCLEQMIRVNRIGQADGEMAAWIDGHLYLHLTGMRCRKTAKLRIKRFNLGLYIHQATRTNVVWYDDVALSTGYIEPRHREQDHR